MSKVLVNEENLTNIANAIREKNQTETTYKPSEMAGAIQEIESKDTTMEDGIISRTLTEYSNDRVTEVGDGAFFNFTNLISIDLPNVTRICYHGFDSCSSLTNINLPKVTTIEDAGMQYNDFDSIYLPSVKTLMNSAFSGCDKLIEPIFPKVDDLRSTVFNGCKAMVRIILPKIKTITKDGIFSGCTSLEKIILPNLTSIGGGNSYSAIFRQCTSLVAIILPKNTVSTLTSIMGTFGEQSYYPSSIVTGGGYIYVPTSLIETYKSSTNWSSLADQIRAIEDYPEICAEVLKDDGTIKTADEIAADMVPTE